MLFQELKSYGTYERHTIIKYIPTEGDPFYTIRKPDNTEVFMFLRYENARRRASDMHQLHQMAQPSSSELVKFFESGYEATNHKGNEVDAAEAYETIRESMHPDYARAYLDGMNATFLEYSRNAPAWIYQRG